MDFTSREEHILKIWKREESFRKSVAQRKGGKPFVFYEGPPTANGRPGIHHVLVRAIKDAFLRYKTMRGFLVERRAGWDTHGLPVELEVEKQLGLRSKQEIEKYGIVEFNAKAKTSVWTYKDEWEKLTDRIGFWIDQQRPYVTYDNRYIESVWGILKSAWQRKLLEEDFKVVPFCIRCGTPLSSHEVAQGYQSVTENSVYVKFKLKNEKNAYILSWTTTPWTLPGNVALAVGADIDYVRVHHDGSSYVLAKTIVQNIFKNEYETLKTMKGSDLIGLEYEPLFDIPEIQNEKSHRVYAADFVNTKEGTGIVHTAVMYGEDDYQLGARVGLPKVHTVLENGRFSKFVPSGLAGRYVKDRETEHVITEHLREHNLLFTEQPYTHDYPFCWRCSTPLLYYATQSWFLRMSQLRPQLLSENEKINWVPEYLKRGRFGEWLSEVKDWAISRERYWGTPLPIWRCQKNEAHIEVVGSVRELTGRIKLKNRYVLVRHAEAKLNALGIVSSYPEAKLNPLTPKGRVAARKAARELQKKKPDVIISSPLLRCRETAEILKKTLDVPVIVEPRIREVELGEYSGRPARDYWNFFSKDPFARWKEKPKNGETWWDVRSRMLSALRHFERRYHNKTIVIVSHGDPLYMLKAMLLGLDDTVIQWKNSVRGILSLLSYPQKGAPELLRGGLLPFDNRGRLDLHKPWIDEVDFPCRECGGVMRRVPEVLDVWFDSGAMPYATRNPKSELRNPKPYPADFICEAIDQTRGWFYTLLAVGVLMGKGQPYKNVLCTGHVLDKQGKKMSKSKGNVVSPWKIVEEYGADAVRWYFYTLNQPWDAKRFDEKDIREGMNKFVGTLWNVYIFWKTYASKKAYSEWRIANSDVKNGHKLYAMSHMPTLDRWILSRLVATNAAVLSAMDVFDITAATRALGTFVHDDLSNWFVRRSRGRFQQPTSKQDHEAGSAFLRYVLVETVKLASPFTPFLADAIWRGLGETASVHAADLSLLKFSRDEKLEQDMDIARRIAALGLAERRAATIPVRQPLGVLEVSGVGTLRMEVLAVVGEEINVKEIRQSDALAAYDKEEGNLRIRLEKTLTPALRVEGAMRELIRAVQELRKIAKLTPNDQIHLRWDAPGIGVAMFRPFEEEIRKAVRANRVEGGPKRTNEKLLAEREAEFSGAKLWFGFRKVK